MRSQSLQVRSSYDLELYSTKYQVTTIHWLFQTQSQNSPLFPPRLAMFPTLLYASASDSSLLEFVRYINSVIIIIIIIIINKYYQIGLLLSKSVVRIAGDCKQSFVKLLFCVNVSEVKTQQQQKNPKSKCNVRIKYLKYSILPPWTNKNVSVELHGPTYRIHRIYTIHNDVIGYNIDCTCIIHESLCSKLYRVSSKIAIQSSDCDVLRKQCTVHTPLAGLKLHFQS